jgi:hypothetical protein
LISWRLIGAGREAVSEGLVDLIAQQRQDVGGIGVGGMARPPS